MTAFFREERAHLEGKLEQQRQETTDKLEQQRREIEEQRRQIEELRLHDVRHRDKQLVALQARLETLHGAKLLDEETLFLTEDAIADSDDAATDRLIELSTKMISDRAFARQLQRKKWL